MPGKLCRDAIREWEAKTGQVAAESTEVSLICQQPYIDKMDNALDTLEMCEKLSLSTNQIDRIINLPKLKQLKILSLGRNNIKRIVGLDEIGQTLEQLWISYNQIEKLEGLNPCIKLHTLFISNNRIRSWDEVGKVAQLPEIKNVNFIGNPIYGGADRERSENWPMVCKKVPQLESIDGKMISASVRQAADALD